MQLTHSHLVPFYDITLLKSNRGTNLTMNSQPLQLCLKVQHFLKSVIV